MSATPEVSADIANKLVDQILADWESGAMDAAGTIEALVEHSDRLVLRIATIEGVLKRRDAAVADCPIDRVGKGPVPGVCPRCQADRTQGCALKVRADAVFVFDARAALKSDRMDGEGK